MGWVHVKRRGTNKGEGGSKTGSFERTYFLNDPIKEEIMGGVARISHWYAQVNTPGMENYDASKRSSYIMYLDANNLYGWAMSQPLPMSNFKWLTDEKMKDLDVMMIPDNSSRGFILECDLSKYYFYYLYIYVYFTKYNVSFLCVSEYPHELHDLNKDYPLAPERLQIEQNILNNYQRHLLQDEGISKPPPKLVPNLCNKTNYIIHYHNLKLYLKLGLDLTNVRPSCFVVRSIAMVEKLHQLQHSSTLVDSCEKLFWKRFL